MWFGTIGACFFTWNEYLLTGMLAKSLAASANTADLVHDSCFLQVCTLISQGNFCLRNWKAPGFFLLIWHTLQKEGALLCYLHVKKKWSFWILIQLIAFFAMNPQVLLRGDVILFRSKYLDIHSWTALCWMLVWGANWLDYHTVVTSLLKVSGALTARGVTDADVFFLLPVCAFSQEHWKKGAPCISLAGPFC